MLDILGIEGANCYVMTGQEGASFMHDRYQKNKTRLDIGGTTQRAFSCFSECMGSSQKGRRVRLFGISLAGVCLWDLEGTTWTV